MYGGLLKLLLFILGRLPLTDPTGGWRLEHDECRTLFCVERERREEFRQTELAVVVICAVANVFC